MLHICICDDSKMDVILLRKYVTESMDELQVAFKLDCFLSGTSLLASPQIYDVYFLDIEMNHMNGIALGKIIKQNYILSKIIYVTGYENYYKDAFQIHAYMYLIKPINKLEIRQTLAECVDYLSNRKDRTILMVFNMVGESIQVDTLRILYFEANNRKIKIVCEGEEIEIRGVLKNILGEVKPFHFAMPHNAYIVNFLHIKKVEGYHVTMKNKDMIPISQKRMAGFRKEYFQFLQQAFHMVR